MYSHHYYLRSGVTLAFRARRQVVDLSVCHKSIAKVSLTQGNEDPAFIVLWLLQSSPTIIVEAGSC